MFPSYYIIFVWVVIKEYTERFIIATEYGYTYICHISSVEQDNIVNLLAYIIATIY